MTTMTNRAATLALLTILAACAPDDGLCEPLECSDDDRCWASMGSMRLEAISADDLELSIGATLEPDGDCYSVTNTDAHVCIVDVGCALLLGRPVTEVELGQPCAPAGPWDTSGTGAVGECLAVFGAVAVAVAATP